jgi:hypothetical protein
MAATVRLKAACRRALPTGDPVKAQCGPERQSRCAARTLLQRQTFPVMQLSSADDKRSSSRPVGTMPGHSLFCSAWRGPTSPQGRPACSGPVKHGLAALRPVLDELQAAKLKVLTAAQAWYARGSPRAAAVPALETVVASADPDAAFPACITLEQALVDGGSTSTRRTRWSRQAGIAQTSWPGFVSPQRACRTVTSRPERGWPAPSPTRVWLPAPPQPAPTLRSCPSCRQQALAGT